VIVLILVILIHGQKNLVAGKIQPQFAAFFVKSVLILHAFWATTAILMSLTVAKYVKLRLKHFALTQASHHLFRIALSCHYPTRSTLTEAHLKAASTV
jgi:hypothetical protein